MDSMEATHPYELRAQPMQNLSQRAIAELYTVVRSEVQLARLELDEKTDAALRGGRSFAFAGVFLVLALLAASAAAVSLLTSVLPIWAAALILAAGYGVIAALLAIRGMTIFNLVGGLVPSRSLERLLSPSEFPNSTPDETERRAESARQDLDRTVTVISQRSAAPSPMRDAILTGIATTVGVAHQARNGRQ